MRRPARFATAWVKCFLLCVNSQSGLLAIAERSMGTSSIKLRLDDKGICRQFANRLSVPLPPVVRMFGMAIDV